MHWGCQQPTPSVPPPPTPRQSRAVFTTTHPQKPSKRPAQRRRSVPCPEQNKELCTLWKQCNEGKMEQCFQLGTRYAGGIKKARRNSKKALHYLGKACKHKHGPACTGLSILYRNGWGVNKDLKKARTLIQKSCKLGHRMGCKRLARMYRLGQGGERSLPKALKMYLLACAKNQIDACHNAALMYQEGQGTSVQIQRSIPLYVKACQQKYPLSCFNIASMLFSGKGTQKDLPKARKYLKLSCDYGYANGCSTYGRFTLEGVGGPKELKKGIISLKRACKLGAGDGCNQLAIHLSKQKVEDPKKKAAHWKQVHTWFEKGCQARSGKSCFNAAINHIRGRGTSIHLGNALRALNAACKLKHTQACIQFVYLLRREKKLSKGDKRVLRKNLQRACIFGESAGCYRLGMQLRKEPKQHSAARTWLHKGCVLNHPLACNQLGVMQKQGLGGAKDASLSALSFQKACSFALASGCYNLGVAYITGQGILKNPKAARHAFTRACQGGQPVACANLAYFVQKGQGGPKGTAKDVQAYLTKACSLGFKPACKK